MTSFTTNNDVGVVILAAGENKRMQMDIPKVMIPLGGKPLIGHVLDAVYAAGICRKPIIVVSEISPSRRLIQEYLKDKAEYSLQDQPLGTGHAVSCAKTPLKGRAQHVVVLYGDMPFITPSSIVRLAQFHREASVPVTLMTTSIVDFEGWRSQFAQFGRIVRERNGHIERIVEAKDATEKELQIKEVNPAYFCFRADWLWRQLRFLKNNNAKAEYYLTDLVEMAIERKEGVQSIEIEPNEAMGINTQEDLHYAEQNWNEMAGMHSSMV